MLFLELAHYFHNSTLNVFLVLFGILEANQLIFSAKYIFLLLYTNSQLPGQLLFYQCILLTYPFQIIVSHISKQGYELLKNINIMFHLHCSFNSLLTAPKFFSSFDLAE